ncbi:MAG: hypothetical protein ABW360_10265 [Phenylobacterium sp.]
MKLTALSVATFALALACGQAAHAATVEEVKFSGKTLSGGKLLEDILAKIASYSQARYQCSSISSINSAMQPASYLPRQPAYRVVGSPRSYERWVVNLCGKPRVFFVAFGNSVNGRGADYKVQELLNGVMP